jgi:hypothetical protein
VTEPAAPIRPMLRLTTTPRQSLADMADDLEDELAALSL